MRNVKQIIPKPTSGHQERQANVTTQDHHEGIVITRNVKKEFLDQPLDTRTSRVKGVTRDHRQGVVFMREDNLRIPKPTSGHQEHQVKVITRDDRESIVSRQTSKNGVR